MSHSVHDGRTSQSRALGVSSANRDGYLQLVKVTYGLTAKQTMAKKAKPDLHERVTVEVENHFRTLPGTVEEYGHFEPSRYLIQHPDALGTHAGDALRRFEALFEALNALL